MFPSIHSARILSVGAVTSALVALVAFGACSSDSDGCTWFDDYRPPSARLQLVNGSTGMPVCDGMKVESERGPVIPLVDICEYRVPVWFANDAGVARVVLQARGFLDTPVDFVESRDRCGALIQPELQIIPLTPEPEAPPPVVAPPVTTPSVKDAGVGDAGVSDGGASADASPMLDGGLDAL